MLVSKICVHKYFHGRVICKYHCTCGGRYKKFKFNSFMLHIYTYFGTRIKVFTKMTNRARPKNTSVVVVSFI